MDSKKFDLSNFIKEEVGLEIHFKNLMRKFRIYLFKNIL